jgi:exonuclease SbcC
MLRSKYAEPDIDTFVEMTFSYNGKNYTVVRSLEHQYLKKYGNVTAKKAAAALTYPNGNLVTGSHKAVTDAVRELIGIDRSQFTQIAMIAQGDFLKLLIASTKERQEIFRRIFQTQNYEALQCKLKDESTILRNKYDEIQRSIKQYIGGIVCEADNLLETDAQKAKDGQLTIHSVLEMLTNLNAQDESKLEIESFTLKTVENEISKIDATLGKVERDIKVRADLDKAQFNLKESAEKLPALQTAYNDAEKYLPEIESLTRQILTEQTKLPKYDELDLSAKELDKKEKSLTVLTTKREELTETIRLKKEKQKALQNELASIKDTDNKKVRLEYELEKANYRKTQLNELIALIREKTKIQTAYEFSEYEYIRLRDSAETANAEYVSLNRAFLDAQAGIFAATLIDGKPCPVCGAKEHPAPADISYGAPTERAVETAKKKADTAQKGASDASGKVAVERGRLEAKYGEVIKAAKGIFGNPPENMEKTISVELNQITDTILRLSNSIKEEKFRGERKVIIEANLPELEKALTNSIEALAADETAIAALTAEISGSKSALQNLKNSLVFAAKADAAKNILALSDRKKKLENTVSAAKELLDNQSRLVEKFGTQTKTLTEQLDGTESFDIIKLREQKTLLSEKKKTLSDKITAISNRLITNTNIKMFVTERLTDVTEVERRYKRVKDLADTANGQLAGKEKITLETYVQVSYFERIIRRANIRLMIMSVGQYELKRAVDASNNRGKSGLELNVIDHYNASERSVKTLSGGESFMASLSLALGLSDEIQSASGGIKLDTMFVDEGFGSLDEDTLSQALKVLNGLAESNLLIGIISHVSELKERIDKQIIVKKERSAGSRVEIIT